MAPSFLSVLAILVIAAVPSNACNFHMRRSYLEPRTGRKVMARAETVDFAYVDSFDWHTLKPENIMCNTGTQQSPINVATNQGFATTHTPSFAGYATATNQTGTFKNWGFGVAYDLDMPIPNDPTSLPSMTFDDQTVYLSGWHVHTPSEHLVDGVRSRGEMHFVHVNAAGEPAAVVGMRIEPSTVTQSHFFAQMPQPLIKPGDATEVGGVVMNPMLAVQEVGHVQQYWTYQGSLTTPPCSEGLRWFLPQQTLKVSQMQMVGMLEVAKYSHRIEQVVWNQMVNV